MVIKRSSRGVVTVLLVDDEPGIREVVAEVLEMDGYKVVQAASAEEGLELARDVPELQVVISDVRMPGMSGLDFVEQIAALERGLKTILISGYFLSDSIQVRFLKKPFSIRDLEAAIEAELAS